VQSVAVFNDFANPLYFLPGSENATVQLTLFNFQSQFQTSWNLLFANILLRPLLDLAPAFSRALRPGGLCVLSGLLDRQARQVESRFRSLGFRLDSRILLDGWTTLLLRRGSGRRGSVD
jgi:ribosomal protein L11 methylase PrmA